MPLFLSGLIYVGHTPTQDLLRGPDERTDEGNFSSLFLSRNELGKAGQFLLKGVKVVVSRNLTLIPGLWLSVLRQLCLRHPMRSVLSLSDLALC